MPKCKNCKKEFVRSSKKTNRHYRFCCSKCYWEFHLKDILKRGE